MIHAWLSSSSGPKRGPESMESRARGDARLSVFGSPRGCFPVPTSTSSSHCTVGMLDTPIDGQCSAKYRLFQGE